MSTTIENRYTPYVRGLTLLISAIISPLVAQAQGVPSAEEILQQARATFDSFRVRQTVCSSETEILDRTTAATLSKKFSSKGTVATDGTRISFSTTHEIFVTKDGLDEPNDHVSDLRFDDGNVSYWKQESEQTDYIDAIQVTAQEDIRAGWRSEAPDSLLDGYLFSEKKPFEEYLDDRAAVSPKMETINGRPCYLLTHEEEGIVRKIWFDPGMGCFPVRGEKQVIGDTKSTASYSFDSVEFVEIEGRAIPKGYSHMLEQYDESGGEIFSRKGVTSFNKIGFDKNAAIEPHFKDGENTYNLDFENVIGRYKWDAKNKRVRAVVEPGTMDAISDAVGEVKRGELVELPEVIARPEGSGEGVKAIEAIQAGGDSVPARGLGWILGILTAVILLLLAFRGRISKRSSRNLGE